MSADEDFEKVLRADLKRSVERLDPTLRARLDAMASAAARRPRPRARPAWQWALPAGGGVVAAALALVFWTGRGGTPVPTTPGADDLALLLNVDNLELLEQMEFYRWLDQQPGVFEDVNAAGAQRS